ncbi:tryptophan synthase subunit alpha [Streptomyces sp. XD-27]|uniref:tryptophan synthase subunit alpha n=1 Tax=Streptomyces sp. XD-27 TaxID=3062779 RepID=UPI0026F4519D|nr:tryptophan synthase subunit alpha [Streptomyces sp. XD-27]WKX69263.1 tryptophan synthase subunit alpha [Streptomyces sp. XD-27]
MAEPRRFFPGRGAHDPGLALFLNAGDPGPPERFEELLLMLDESGVDCLELAVPFPDSITDGPVIRRSALRALDSGVDLAWTLDLLARVRPRMRHTRVALLADWRASVHPVGPREFLARARDAGADGVLVHGAPPRARPGCLEAAAHLGQPMVTTCYARSDPAVLEEAARTASAYLYLVAHYGRTGSAALDRGSLEPVLSRLKKLTEVPVAVGFGVRTAADVAAVGRLGADAAVVGTAVVARLERALLTGADPVTEARACVAELLESAAGPPGSATDTSTGRNP